MFVQYQTYPSLPLIYKIADEILELLAMRFLNVFSHHWHWQNIPYDEKFNDFGVSLKGAPSGNPHNNPFFGVIAHLGGRPYGYILEADNSSKGYFLGFKHPGSNHMRRCNIRLTGPVMLLTGPDDGCTIFAFDKGNNPIKLNRLSDLIHRKHKPDNIRIL